MIPLCAMCARFLLKARFMRVLIVEDPACLRESLRLGYVLDAQAS